MCELENTGGRAGVLNRFKNKLKVVLKVVQDVENESAWVSMVVKNNRVVLASRHIIESCVW